MAGSMRQGPSARIDLVVIERFAAGQIGRRLRQSGSRVQRRECKCVDGFDPAEKLNRRTFRDSHASSLDALQLNESHDSVPVIARREAPDR